MPAKDKFHDVVKNALIKEDWKITDDPLTLEYGKRKMFVDLAAEKLFSAEKDGRKIAVEVKSFLSLSELTDLEEAFGQYTIYQTLLKRQQPDRKLYLAIPQEKYFDLFDENEIGNLILEDYNLSIIVFDIANEVIVEWIN
jgi:hypothetical protein